MTEENKTGGITAYSIYKVEQKKRTKINPLEDVTRLYQTKSMKSFMQTRRGIMAEKCSMTNQQ